MRKIQFGSGCLPIDGWENHDMDMDITKPLPIEDACVDYILAEMVLEHVIPRDGYAFLVECYRILKLGGVARIVIPDFVKIWREKNNRWFEVNTGVTHCSPDWKDNMKSVIVAHGHQAIWSSELLQAVMESIGFTASIKEAGESDHPELKDVEQHHKSVGLEVARAESGCVEGRK